MKYSRTDTAEDVNEDDLPQLPHIVGCRQKALSIPESDDEGHSEPKDDPDAGDDDLQDLDAHSVWDSTRYDDISIISSLIWII